MIIKTVMRYLYSTNRPGFWAGVIMTMVGISLMGLLGMAIIDVLWIINEL